MRPARSLVPAALSSRLDLAVSLAVTVLAVEAFHLALSGRLSMTRVFALFLAPFVGLAATLRPGWVVLALLAVPPGLMTRVSLLSPKFLVALLVVVLGFQWLRRGWLAIPAAAAAPLLAILVLAVTYAVELAPAASVVAASLRNSLAYDLALFVAAYALARSGVLSARAVALAIAVSVAGTAVILLAQTASHPSGLVLISGTAPADPGLLDHRTHAGYFMAMGFAVAFGRLLWRPAWGALNRAPLWAAVLSAVFLVMTGLSFARGAWVVAILLILVLPWLAGRRSYWLLVPIPLLLFDSFPLVRQRLTGDLSGGLQASIASGQLGTHRVQLWRALWEKAVDLPWGHGFGYEWTLTPERLVGIPGVFVTSNNPFVYPHNDFLFWLIELGVVGALLFAGFWALLVRGLLSSWRSRDAVAREAVFLLGGAVLVMLVAELFDNGLFIQSVAERFFAAAGIVLAAAATARARSADPGPVGEKR